MKRRQCKKTPEIEFLKSMAGIDWGENVATEHKTRTTQKQLNKYFRGIGWQPSIANYKVQDHLDGINTLYYSSTLSNRLEMPAPLIYPMIDIDVNKASGLGSIEGGRACAAYLRELFPNLYFEPSTGGFGQHGYLCVDTCGYDTRYVNAVIKQFEKALLPLEDAFDIELIEMKATCLETEWVDLLPEEHDPRRPHITQKRVVRKSAQLGKLPRLTNGLEALKNTARVNIDDLAHFELPSSLTKTVIAVIKPEKAIHGSCDFMPSEEACDAIEHFNDLGEKLIAKAPVECAGRLKVTKEDYGAALIILHHLFLHPNTDGQMPTNRIKSVWDALYDREVINRPWNHSRWAGIRNHMDQMKFIDWESNQYWFDESGSGEAMKWSISMELYEVLDGIIEGRSHTDNRERELYANNIEIKEPSEWIRPELVFNFETEAEKTWRMEQELITMFSKAA